MIMHYGWKTWLRLAALALAFNMGIASAHEATDWRGDTQAFKSNALKPLQVGSFYLGPQSVRTVRANEALKKMLTTKLTQFTAVERGSVSGRDQARAFLDREFKAVGFKTRLQEYGTGKNFIAEKAGQDSSKVLVLSAHLDSMKNAGADDDGSGVIGALAVATAFKNRRLKYTLRFVGFDEEEQGLIGSTAYVKSLTQGEKLAIRGLINLEMIAYNGRNDGAFHVIDCDRSDSISLSAAVLGAVQKLALPLKLSPACTQRSDHAPFWRNEIPAIVVSQNFFGGDSNPCYHRACDQMSSQLNLDYMTLIVQAVTSAVQTEL